MKDEPIKKAEPFETRVRSSLPHGGLCNIIDHQRGRKIILHSLGGAQHKSVVALGAVLLDEKKTSLSGTFRIERVQKPDEVIYALILEVDT
jgi:hypothetical protein